MLKTCPYRRSKRSYLECNITEAHGKNSTSLTSKEICNQCSIPTIVEQVNCKHLLLGKFHLAMEKSSLNAMISTAIIDIGWQAECKAIGFSDRDDFKSKCSQNCPHFWPRHRDLSNEALISIPNIDVAKVNDRERRQAVLAILYIYHTRHPERYHYFDVTPEFLAKSLGITIPEVLQVVSPMEDEKEVVTESYLAAPYFRYIKITNQGIRMIDEEPIFGSLDTAKVRVMGDWINLHNSQLGALNIGDNNQIKGDIMSEASKYDLRGSNFPGGFAENNYGKMVETQINYAAQQNLAEAEAEIQQLLTQLQTKGYSPKEAQKQVATDLAQQAQSNPINNKLVKWGQYISDAAANGIIGDVAVEVIKLALRLASIPIP